jgi:deazaflavin-dependent oxidoreductase (nitroreductase family)
MTDIDKGRLRADAGALHEFNRRTIAEFRATGGKVDDLPGGTVLLLHTTGAKSGQPRISPLAFIDLDGRMLIAGSSLGAQRDPAWVHNLRAQPRAHVEVGTDSYDVIARELPSDERDEVYPKLSALAPVLAEYQSRTERAIPVFELAVDGSHSKRL